MNPSLKRHSRAIAASVIAAGIALVTASGVASAASWSPTATRATDVRGLAPVGHAPASASLNLVIGLKIQNRDQFNDFFKHLTTYGDPAFGKSISSASFVSEYSPTVAQAQSVVDFLTRAGFTNIHVAANRLLITADATVAGAEKAFDTQISQYRVGGELRYANTLPVKVPSSFGDLILSVSGLQDLSRPKTMHTQLKPLAKSPQTSYAPYFLPSQMPHIYGADGTPNATSLSAAIISSGDMSDALTDFATYLSMFDLPNVPVDVFYVGKQGRSSSGTDEWDLDSQTIVGMGGGLGHLYFYASQKLDDAGLTSTFNQAVSDDLVHSINVSIGGCESGPYGDGSMATDDEIFQAGIAQGQTFYISSGDSGSAECSGATGVSYPASSPYVVSVGGTSLTVNGAGDYASETAWSGGGGGVSVYEPNVFQSSVSSSAFRSVPDIAADADPATGMIIVYKGTLYSVGGTSVAAPISTGASLHIWSYFGTPTYFLTPLIYAYVPAYMSSTHDITSGSNGAYSAGLGYDLVTGVGSWDVYCDIFSCNPN